MITEKISNRSHTPPPVLVESVGWLDSSSYPEAHSLFGVEPCVSALPMNIARVLSASIVLYDAPVLQKIGLFLVS